VLSPDRCFDADPTRRAVARELYASVKDLPLVCPHGHVPPALLADPAAHLGTPAELFIIPDHYVFRMLYSQGVALEDLGVPTRDGTPVETDHRKIWQRFAEQFHLFRGTPTGLWLADELVTRFGVTERLDGASAQRIYDHLAAQLARPEFAPRALLERFQIELLCTTDAATTRSTTIAGCTRTGCATSGRPSGPTRWSTSARRLGRHRSRRSAKCPASTWPTTPATSAPWSSAARPSSSWARWRPTTAC